jgi:hypothetical protein
MKGYEEYLNELVSHNERNFLDSSRGIDIESILQDGGIKDAKFGGYGGREYIEFTYRGKRYEVIQVDKPEDWDERFKLPSMKEKQPE